MRCENKDKEFVVISQHKIQARHDKYKDEGNANINLLSFQKGTFFLQKRTNR